LWSDARDANFDDIEKYDRRARDKSAPPPSTSSSSHGAGRDEPPIALSACLSAYTEEETLEESDAWYCSTCKEFKCATKKIDLWRLPKLLIIHLKRFSYTSVWRDRINTLVNFPLDGLDLQEWVSETAPQKEPNQVVYDCYAVSNHMGGLGGGHYTAYAKNLESKQWYHLDDSRTSPVGNTKNIVSSAAYVLYYVRRDEDEPTPNPTGTGTGADLEADPAAASPEAVSMDEDQNEG
jgi:ubiquitin carboxyl-terminal hydrolase 4/11/15